MPSAKIKKTNIELNIAPMSVNAAWQGRRFATRKYKEWTETCLFMLLGKKCLEKPYKVSIIFYQSQMQDIDSCIKMTLDVLVKAGVLEDDRYINELNVKKIVSKERKIFIEIN